MGAAGNQIWYFFILITVLSCGMRKSVMHRPDLTGFNSTIPAPVRHNDSLFSIGNNFLLKNPYGQWELYVEGDPLERGLLIGSLSDSILLRQERVFFDKIKEIIPSEEKQKQLRKFLQWYNRELYRHVPEEYKAEIYGLSRFSAEENNHIASPYIRALYLHAAHDIGHALQDLALVGCTSAALWGEKTDDGGLLIGRNFDFYAGDDFAANKIIAFINPSSGIPFMMATWPGMLGVVSGMNYKGLTVTINAGKSDIPLKAKKPVSILAREILQYASTIEEAIKIAGESEVFVSESLMIGSAEDKRAVLIEISPGQTGVYEVANTNQLVCSNHFQSETFQEDRRNLKQIRESHSKYRFERMSELIENNPEATPQVMAEILRDKRGMDDKKIGFGNEKALNQLLAHHAIIFKPEKLQVWVSSDPYQLGAFTAYDLHHVFGEREPRIQPLFIDSLTIPPDKFLYSEAYLNYEEFRIADKLMDDAVKNKKAVSPEELAHYESLNPDFWKVYYKIGRIYYGKGDFHQAKKYFAAALEKEITTLPDKENIERYLRKANRKIR